MCRLFGLAAGHHEVRAQFWLLDATDSLREQSRRNRDGSGIGYFDATGTPRLDKQPEAAFEDAEFSREARAARSHTFVSHVRFATTGRRTVENTHPFAIAGRIMAHNGGFGALDLVEERLGDYRTAVLGDTDSERFAALIAAETDAHNGDVPSGIEAAVNWLADNVPLYSLNLVLATPTDLYAVRFPDFHRLFVLERGPGGLHGTRALHLGSEQLQIHVPELQIHPSVVIASEPMDDSSGWRLVGPGDLLHVDEHLHVTTRTVRTADPAHFRPPHEDAVSLPH